MTEKNRIEDASDDFPKERYNPAGRPEPSQAHEIDLCQSIADMEYKLAGLELDLKALRAERNALARAVKTLKRFY